jgi:hypothetical protein
MTYIRREMLLKSGDLIAVNTWGKKEAVVRHAATYPM